MRRTHHGILLALAATTLLIGCLPKRSIRVSYTAEPAVETPNRAVVAVWVDDDRPFVKSGRKPPSYLGFYLGGTGINFDVTTENGEALAAILQRDVMIELQALGFEPVPLEHSGRTLMLSILDWRYEPRREFLRLNVFFWYEVIVQVLDSDGRVLARHMVGDQLFIEGDSSSSAHTMEREMPGIYSAFIHKLVRETPEIREALVN